MPDITSTSNIIISPEADTDDKKLELLFRLEQRYINKLNSLKGTRDYMLYHNDVFTPSIARIRMAMEDAKETARNFPEPLMENDIYANTREAFLEGTRYDAVISRDNKDVR